MTQITYTSIYQLNPKVVIEFFEDGALVLKLEERQLVEFTPIPSDILRNSDGVNNVGVIAELIASEFQISLEIALQEVIDLYDQLTEQKIIIELHPHLQKGNKNMTENISSTSSYLCNPDVVLREEDEDGGLLFNPDTSQVKVVNTTGLFIWKQFGQSNEVNSVVQAMLAEFEDAPQDEIFNDVQEFLDEMLQTGFIGTIETD